MNRIHLRRTRIWLPGILVLVVAAAAMLGGGGHFNAATTSTPLASTTEFGLATGGVSLATETSQFGHVPLVRVYNAGLPQAWPGNAGANNSDVVVSFKALPATILSGTNDAQLTAWFKGAPTTHTVWWTYYHEPEDQIAAGTFTAASYRAAWAHLVALAAKANNTHLRATLILMSWTLNPKSHRTFSDYYPGDSVINTLGWDGYPGSTTLTPPDQFMGPAVALSKSMGKPFGFAEFGSPIVAGRGPWLTSVGQYLRSNGAVFGTYFNSTNGANYVLNDQTSISAWKTVMNSGGTGPTPTPTARPTSTPTPTATPRPTPTPVPTGLTLSHLSITASGSSHVISVSVSADAHVSVAIIDSKGITVRNKVADASVSAGTFTFSYAGYNDAGTLLPAGSYTVLVVATDRNQAIAIATGHLQL